MVEITRLPAVAPPIDVEAGQTAINANLRHLRLDLAEPTNEIQLRMLLVSLLEWCSHHAVDFGAAVGEVEATWKDACAAKATTVAAPYRTAAEAAGWRIGGGDVIYDSNVFGSWKEAVSYSGDDDCGDEAMAGSPTYSTWQECCEGEGIAATSTTTTEPPKQGD